MHPQQSRMRESVFLLLVCCAVVFAPRFSRLHASEALKEPAETDGIEGTSHGGGGSPISDAELHAAAKAAIEEGKQADAAALILQMSYAYRRDNDLLQYPAMLGATPPRARMQTLINTLIGGKGRQTMSSITISDDLILVGKGEGWSITYDLNDPRARGVVEGDINVEDSKRYSTGPRPPIDWKKEWDNAPRFLDIRNGQTIRFMTWQAHTILQQPFVESSAGWTMWGWWHSICEKNELMADSRCYKVWPIQNDKYGALVWTDGGTTTLARNPQDISKRIRVSGDGFGKHPRLGFAVVNADTGAVESMAAYFGNPPFFAIDPWGRMVTGGDFKRRAGVTVMSSRNLDVEYSTGLAGHKWGEDRPSDAAKRRRYVETAVNAFVLHDNIVAVGGVTMVRSLSGARNHVQQRSGGDGDAFLFVGKLW